MPVSTPPRGFPPLRSVSHRRLLAPLLVASAALAGCHGDQLSASPALSTPAPAPVTPPSPAPSPMPSPTPVTVPVPPIGSAPLPPVIRCAPGATASAAIERKTELAADCHAAAKGAQS
ncbi:MAG: hypothetical protein V4709_12040 [Pseudomonadota bacterium]